ncbi:MAG: hypothetical protein ACK53I_08620, partial [Phenylobacterium sp.]
MRRLILIATVPALLLAGCAGGAPAPSSATGLPVVGESAYGLFLAGGAAMNAGRNSEAARFLELARAGGGDDPAIDERAFTSALLAGDVKTAAAIAPEGAEVSEPTRRLGR